MRTDPIERTPQTPPSVRWTLGVAVAAVVGLVLMGDTAWQTSATYDEVAYVRIAATWWRTGEQAEITRMGSPLTFWKLQQAPVFWVLDRVGRSDLVDDPLGRQAELLPLVRIGALWVWLVGFALTVAWSRSIDGPRAAVVAAWLFALSPNLLAHGALVTMEAPLVAAWTAAFFLFWRFLRGGRAFDFWASAVVSGLAFSCKFTAVLIPPLLAVAWWWERRGDARSFETAAEVARGMTGFGVVMVASNLAVTAFAVLPLSPTRGEGHPSLDGRYGQAVGGLVTRVVETPIPQDWVGFATQTRHQKSGGTSYLFGERRSRGWWYYYFVALAVKVPLTVWALVVARGVRTARTDSGRREAMIPLTSALFLAATALGSSRNYGVRYLLPLAPMAIVWVAGLADCGKWGRRIAWAGVLGQAVATAGIHPNELTYFNAIAGGPVGGRRVLADSNLDWGQGLKALVRLQAREPRYRDLTLYYFGDASVRPDAYGVAATSHVIDAGEVQPSLPPDFEPKTPYVAVSASLQWGPWGPAGYFRRLDGVRPVAMTDDTTIAVYRTADIPQ